MQTIYYTTSNFIRHTDNVVDFAEYRRKLALAEEGSLAPVPQVEEYDDDYVDAPVLREVKPTQSRSGHRRDLSTMLDLYASLSVVVVTLSFALKVLL